MFIANDKNKFCVTFEKTVVFFSWETQGEYDPPEQNTQPSELGPFFPASLTC